MDVKISLTDEQFRALLSWLEPQALLKAIVFDAERVKLLTSELDFMGVKVDNLLRRIGINTYADLVSLNDRELLKYSGVGKKVFQTILDHLKSKGLYLGMCKK